MSPTSNPDSVAAGASIVALTDPATSAYGTINFERLAARFAERPVAPSRVPCPAELAV